MSIKFFLFGCIGGDFVCTHPRIQTSRNLIGFQSDSQAKKRSLESFVESLFATEKGRARKGAILEGNREPPPKIDVWLWEILATCHISHHIRKSDDPFGIVNLSLVKTAYCLQ